MKKVIITGATGFIGRNLIKELIKNNEIEIFAIIRPSSHNRVPLFSCERVHVIEAQMNDYYQLASLIAGPCDSLIHLAWHGVRGQERMDPLIQQNSYENSMQAIVCAKALGCSLIISAGSQAEYGLYTESITEDTPCCPVTPYGIEKVHFYSDCMSYCQENSIRFIEPRFFSIYGPDDFRETLILSVLNKMLKNEVCQLTLCEQMWDFLYIDDCIRALILLLTTPCTSGVYNIGSGIHNPLKHYIEIMARLTKTSSPLELGAIPYPKGGMVHVMPSIIKLQNATNFRPQITFECGIRKILKETRVD